MQTAAAAYDMAGIGPKDIDVVEIYDAFTISVIVGLEDLGFCEKGEGGPIDRPASGPAPACPSIPPVAGFATATRGCSASSCWSKPFDS